MPKYNLTTPEAIAISAKTAQNHAARQPNQSSYNAAWMHGYAVALKDVARQLSLEKAKADSLHTHMGNEEPLIKLWARVGMTIFISKDIYNSLLQTDRGELLQDIITGKKGKTFLDGETYFPDLEQNLKLSEREYHLYDRRQLPLAFAYEEQLNTKSNLDNMIQAASDRSTHKSSSDDLQQEENHHEK